MAAPAERMKAMRCGGAHKACASCVSWWPTLAYGPCGDVWPKRSPASIPITSATRYDGPKQFPSSTRMRRGDLANRAFVFGLAD